MLSIDATLDHHQKNEGQNHCESEDQSELIRFLHVSKCTLEEARIGHQGKVAGIKDEEHYCHSLQERVEGCS